MTLRDRIEAARQAQQRHEQMHDVQLEVPGWESSNPRRHQAHDRPEFQEPEEDDCSLENWEHYAARIGIIDNHSKSEKV